MLLVQHHMNKSKDAKARRLYGDRNPMFHAIGNFTLTSTALKAMQIMQSMANH